MATILRAAATWVRSYGPIGPSSSGWDIFSDKACIQDPHFLCIPELQVPRKGAAVWDPNFIIHREARHLNFWAGKSARLGCGSKFRTHVIFCFSPKEGGLGARFLSNSLADREPEPCKLLLSGGLRMELELVDL